MNKLVIIEVMPDYMSSGLWQVYDPPAEGSYHCNIEWESLKLRVPDIIKVALRHWHHIWEIFIAEDKCRKEYADLWYRDGEVIVRELNAISIMQNAPYKFVYKVKP